MTSTWHRVINKKTQSVFWRTWQYSVKFRYSWWGQALSAGGHSGAAPKTGGDGGGEAESLCGRRKAPSRNGRCLPAKNPWQL